MKKFDKKKIIEDSHENIDDKLNKTNEILANDEILSEDSNNTKENLDKENFGNQNNIEKTSLENDDKLESKNAIQESENLKSEKVKKSKKTKSQKVARRQKHSFKETWGKLFIYCKKFFPAIVIALVFAIGGAVFTIIGPDKISEMVETIMAPLLVPGSGGIDMKKITSIALTLVAFYSASVVLGYLQGFIMASVTQKITKKMREDISTKINRLPLRYFDSTSHGDVLSRVTNDVDTLGQMLNQSIVGLVSALTLFVGSIIMMFVTNWILAFVAIGSSLFGFAFMGIIVGKAQKYFVAQQKELGELNGHIEEVYTGHNVVKAYNAEKSLYGEFDKINKKLYSSSFKSQFLGGLMMPMMNFVGNLGYVAVCVIGAVLSLKGITGFQDVVAFMIYVRLFTQPLSTFAQSMSGLQSAGAASYRVFEFLGEAELDDESHKSEVLKDAKGNIEFKNIKFGYLQDKTIINNFSATVKAGQKVAIVGPTGAGKTTMVNLLMRFYEINDGQILIDGVPTQSLTRENVHDLFCMVLQDTWLFEGTIYDNIVYNNKNIPLEKVIEASKAVGLHHFIQTLPQGYNTPLNEEANLSAGQKQLVTIARAMVDDAPMLILDEATSNVDTRTEVLIQKAMDKLMTGRTSIVIAHRLSTIKNADLILVMKDGDIIESGNHQQLLEKGGFYADLYNSQFEQEG